MNLLNMTHKDFHFHLTKDFVCLVSNSKVKTFTYLVPNNSSINKYKFIVPGDILAHF